MKIGFSNGDLHKLFKKASDRFNNYFMKAYKANNKTNAIELNFNEEERIDYFLDLEYIDLTGFEWISVHAPIVEYQDDKDSNRILDKLEKVYKKYSINNFVFHADKGKDRNVFDRYNIPASIENMNSSKSFGKTVEDIKQVLDKHNFGFTFDIQHAFVNKNPIMLTESFQRTFKDRLVEYHLSGYNENFSHYPLFINKQHKIINNIMYTDVPIIIESVLSKMEEIEKELDFIISNLKKKS